MMSSETQPLITPSNAGTRSGHGVSFRDKSPLRVCIKNTCLPSKAAVLIILWTILVGTVYSIITIILGFSIHGGKYSSSLDAGLFETTLHAVLAIVLTLYPISGFIADIYCGRLKTVVASAIFILLSLVVISGVTLIMTLDDVQFYYSSTHYYTSHKLSRSDLVLLILAALFFIVGLAGYQANYIQLGLDQLLEAPSEYLGLFTHWAVWSFSLTSSFIIALTTMIKCTPLKQLLTLSRETLPVPFLLAVMLVALLFIGYWKRHWFYFEPGQYNPYKTVFQVLKFAKKHKRPLRRSAFTYSDDCIPSRLDFAKERFGGPFTTEQVENVKTFFRLLLLLITLGPTYVILVPASPSFFPLFGQHIGRDYRHHCTIQEAWALMVEIGGLSALLSSSLMPLYIWFVYSALKRKPLKILTRLKLGIVLSCLGIFSMFVIDVAGHSIKIAGSDNETEIQCMFHVAKQNDTVQYQPLNMHWSVLIPPSLFFAVGPPIVRATTLEFISAQSPHSMKGLLVGISFAIQGVFQLCGHLTVLPLSLTNPWVGERISPIISCGFSYFLFTCLVGLTGLIIFSIMAKKYKYRKRDDENFSQIKVEEVYSRYLTQVNTGAGLDELTE